jgi:hypothetical protein
MYIYSGYAIMRRERRHIYIHTCCIQLVFYYDARTIIKCDRRTFLALNTSTFLQTTSAAEAHLAEGQFLLEEQTFNKAKSLIYREGTRRPANSKTEGRNSEPKNKENSNINVRYIQGGPNCGHLPARTAIRMRDTPINAARHSFTTMCVWKVNLYRNKFYGWLITES